MPAEGEYPGSGGSSVEPGPGEACRYREARVGAARANRVCARVEVRDVVLVDVEPVEREVDEVRRALEGARAADDSRVVELHEAERGVDLVKVGRTELHVGDRAAVHARSGFDEPQLAPQGAEGLSAGRGVVGGGRDPGVGAGQDFEGPASL